MHCSTSHNTLAKFLPSRLTATRKFFKMFFASRIIGFAACLFALMATIDKVAGSPAKRDNAGIEIVLNTLKSQTDTILPQFETLVPINNTLDVTVPQLFNQLTSALDDASSSLQSMQSPAPVARRRSDSDIAQLVAGIISDIGNALNGLESVASSIPDLDILLGGVDASLNQVLLGLSTLLQGVLTLVADLLVDVAALLRGLALGLSLGTLGL